MQGRRSAIGIAFDEPTHATLSTWLRNRKPHSALAKRVRAILLLADGYSFAATARQGELRERHVRKWALWLVAHSIEGFYNKQRPEHQPVFLPGSHVCGQIDL